MSLNWLNRKVRDSALKPVARRPRLTSRDPLPAIRAVISLRHRVPTPPRPQQRNGSGQDILRHYFAQPCGAVPLGDCSCLPQLAKPKEGAPWTECALQPRAAVLEARHSPFLPCTRTSTNKPLHSAKGAIWRLRKPVAGARARVTRSGWAGPHIPSCALDSRRGWPSDTWTSGSGNFHRRTKSPLLRVHGAAHTGHSLTGYAGFPLEALDQSSPRPLPLAATRGRPTRCVAFPEEAGSEGAGPRSPTGRYAWESLLKFRLLGFSSGKEGLWGNVRIYVVGGEGFWVVGSCGGLRLGLGLEWKD